MAEKLALVDKDQLLRLLGRVNPQPPPDPSLREMGRAESELDEVLSRDASSNQVKEIGHIIAKHNFHKTNYENEPQGPPMLTRHLPTSSVVDDSWAAKTVDATPGKFQRNARSLLEHIKNSGRVSWDKDGQLVADGTVLQGTNILDLIHSVVRPRRAFDLPKGAAEFLAALDRVNTPRELVQNAHNVRKKLNMRPPKKESKHPPARKVTIAESASTPVTTRAGRKKKWLKLGDAPNAAAPPPPLSFPAHESWARIRDTPKKS